MNQNNLKSWTYTNELNNLLFFAQRMDELLFHYSTDSYRYPVLSLRGLAAEYCSVYEDKNINGKNLDHIIEEFENALKNDVVANKILTKEYSERFVKKYGTWSNLEFYKKNLLHNKAIIRDIDMVKAETLEYLELKIQESEKMFEIEEDEME